MSIRDMRDSMRDKANNPPVPPKKLSVYDLPKIKHSNAINPPKVRLKVPPTVRVSSKPTIHVKAYKVVGEQLSRRGELARLEQAIIDLNTLGYTKTRINELSKDARAFAKSSSKVTAKELLDFYAQVITRPEFGGKAGDPNRTEQDDRNIQFMRDIIYGLYKAIGLYEDIVRQEQDEE
jgi:hypothetical protein